MDEKTPKQRGILAGLLGLFGEEEEEEERSRPDGRSALIGFEQKEPVPPSPAQPPAAPSATVVPFQRPEPAPPSPAPEAAPAPAEPWPPRPTPWSPDPVPPQPQPWPPEPPAAQPEPPWHPQAPAASDPWSPREPATPPESPFRPAVPRVGETWFAESTRSVPQPAAPAPAPPQVTAGPPAEISPAVLASISARDADRPSGQESPDNSSTRADDLTAEPAPAQPADPTVPRGIQVPPADREAYEPGWYQVRAARRLDAGERPDAEVAPAATESGFGEDAGAPPPAPAEGPRYDYADLSLADEADAGTPPEAYNSPAVQAALNGDPEGGEAGPATRAEPETVEPQTVQPEVAAGSPPEAGELRDPEPIVSEGQAEPAPGSGALAAEMSSPSFLSDAPVFEIPLEFDRAPAEAAPEALPAEAAPAEAAQSGEAPEALPAEPTVEPPPEDQASTARAMAPDAPAEEAPSAEAPAPEAPVPTEQEAEPEAAPAARAGEPPAETAEQPIPAEAAAPPTRPVADTSALSSTVVAERRMALRELTERGVQEGDVERVGRLLLDPEREIRELAVEALMQVADSVPPEHAQRALQDPTDQVRAAAVRLAAARSGRTLPDVLQLVAARRWPLTQAAALEILPVLIEERGIQDHELTSILAAVAKLESSPVHAERPGFAGLARAIGRDRLIAGLNLPDDRRLGAVRLLFEEGSGASLRAVAARDTDPIEEIRYTAQQATDLLASMERVTYPERPLPESEPAARAREIPVEVVEESTEVEMIAGLARVLQDPDESVRDRARIALSQVSRSAVTRWAKQAIRTGTVDQATLGARVAETIQLSDLAADVLERAADLQAESRGAFMGALASFNMTAAALVDLIGAVDPSRRQEAIRLLWQVAGRSILPHLRDSLKDSSGPVRMAVLEVFGESGDPAAIEVAQTVLEMDSSPAVRATAIQVMGRAGLEHRVASLAQALSDPDPDVRSTAVEVLPQGMGRHAAQLLLKALGDHDERVWTAAIRHLVMLPERDLPIVWSALRQCPARQREQLISQLERTSVEKLALLALEHVDSPDYAERILAVELAGRAGTLECTHAAIQALLDPAPPVRRTAAAALSGLRSPAAVPALGKALNDPDPEVRVEAVRALGVVDDDAVLSFLVSALKDPELRVREVASEALTHWSSPTVAKRLAEVLTLPDLRRPASELLTRMGPASVEPLVDILVQGDPEVVATVGQLLERIAGPDRFLDDLSAMDPSTRGRAVEALGAIGGPRAVDGLIRTLSDPDEGIRSRSIRLLGELGDARAFEPVKRTFLGDPVAEVVSAAEEALRRLQPDHPDTP